MRVLQMEDNDGTTINIGRKQNETNGRKKENDSCYSCLSGKDA